MNQSKRFRPHKVDPDLLERAKAMRHEPAPAEQKLWRCIRNRRLNGFKFRRQHGVTRFITDYYCAECKLVVELDGDSHEGRAQYDRNRTELLKAEGLHLIRFLNTDLFENLDGVLEAILQECERRARHLRQPLAPTLSPGYRGEGVRDADGRL